MPAGLISDSREEFVKGRTIELPPASPAHARLIERLNALLRRSLFDTADTWRILTSSYALGIEPGFRACRNPDLAVFRREDLQQARVESNNIFAVPRLVVECLSPRDRKGPLPDLLEDYHRMRAIEVWIIDPYERTVSRHLATDERAEQLTRLVDPLQAIELPAVSLSIEDLWRAFDGEW
jgi:Uma2 family endonuclease